MDKTREHGQTPVDRAATAHIRRLITHMNRSQRLAIALLLVKACFDEADKLTDLVHIEPLVLQGGQDFNERVDDIRLLLPQMPTRYLAEIAAATLLPEVSFMSPSNHT